MSLACGLPLLECVYCLACARWAWKRCLHSGEVDSATWGLASAADFELVPRMCRLVMANYEPDLSPSAPLLFAPPGGYGIDPACVLRRRTYADREERELPTGGVQAAHELERPDRAGIRQGRGRPRRAAEIGSCLTGAAFRRHLGLCK